MRRFTAVLLTALLIIGAACVPAAAADSSSLSLEAESAILLDLTTGKVLYEKNADALQYPASTTKMMTAILALERLDLTKTIVVDDEVHATTGSVFGLEREEQISAKDVLYSMMVRSANDCAVAIAKQISGSVENFSELMNMKAREIGCDNTNFTNPHGLHSDDHYTTARDLATIAMYCMKNETFREMVALPTYTSAATNKHSALTWVNTNYLLNDEQEANRIYVGNQLRYCKYEGCIGIKTGYTTQAGGCLVSAAERDGTTLLSVVLKSGSYGRFADSHKLLDYGFANYRTLHVMDEGSDMGTIKVHKGEFNKTSLILKGNVDATVPMEAADSIITTEIMVEEMVDAPIEAGTVVGSLVVYESGSEIDRKDIVIAETVNEGGLLSNFDIEDSTADKIKWTALGILGLIFVAIFSRIMYLRAETKRKRAIRDQRRAEKRAQEARARAAWEASYERRYGVRPDENSRRSYYDDDRM